jgi:thioredoxin 1
MAIVEVNDQNFQNEIHSGVVLVDFWAPWCGPCRMITPVLEEINNEIGDKIKIGKLNVDSNPRTSTQFGVLSIPTLLLFKEGQLVEEMVGYQPKEHLISIINKHI